MLYPPEPKKRVFIKNVTVRSINDNSFDIPITLRAYSDNDKKITETTAIIDSGAQGSFIDEEFVRLHRLPTANIPFPIEPRNADGTVNTKGMITKTAWINYTIQGKLLKERCYVTGDKHAVHVHADSGNIMNTTSALQQ